MPPSIYTVLSSPLCETDCETRIDIDEPCERGPGSEGLEEDGSEVPDENESDSDEFEEGEGDEGEEQGRCAHGGREHAKDGNSWEEREAPTVADALAALGDLKGILYPRWANARGFKDSNIDTWTRGRLGEMETFLHHYTGPHSRVNGHWTAAAIETAVGRGKKPGHSRLLRAWTKAYIRNRNNLPTNPYGAWSKSHLDEDDLSLELQIHLRSLGKYVSAMDIVHYLDRPEIKVRLKMSKTISLATAKRWMAKMGYVWVANNKGQYVDGHERDDVVAYRKEVFLPAWFRIAERTRSWGGEHMDEEILVRLPGCGRTIIVWFHDESIFYANDRRKSHWKGPTDTPKPEPKGEGASLMVSDFVSADFGWLRSPPGIEPVERARILLKPGKSRDGYQTNEDVVAQAEKAMNLLTKWYPQYDHIFVYDNATIHTKRPVSAPSARKAPKNTPKGAKNWGPKVPVRDNNGKVVMDGEKVREEMIRMADGTHNGAPQSLYYATDHPEHSGKFKGMAKILEERGYGDMSKVPYECKSFKCDATKPRCCCRRMLYNEPDFANGKSHLEEVCEARGFTVLFLPKFHCELNFIEQCWGHAKRVYRLNPPSSKEADLERNLLASLDAVDVTHMRRSVFYLSFHVIRFNLPLLISRHVLDMRDVPGGSWTHITKDWMGYRQLGQARNTVVTVFFPRVLCEILSWQVSCNVA